ncbi:MAG: aminopeptidase [Candidatus Bathyarchaeota archaeon]|nr:MAG: aminopeptidase [Candidatus Bathyarchaeota archaeon]
MFDYFERSKGAKILLEDCFRVTSGMDVLVITDTKLIHTGEVLARAAQAAGAEAVIAVMAPRKRDGDEPPQSIALAAKGADLCICATQSLLIHTKAISEAREAGVITVSLQEGEDERLDEFNTTIEDLKKMKETNQKLVKALTGGDKIRITTPSGSDLTLSIKGRTVLSLEPHPREREVFPENPEDFSEDFCFPDWMGFAEVPVAPVKGSANGVYVVDAFMQSIGGIREPIVWKIQEGKVVEIRGGDEAERLKELIQGADENATNIAELGIGTNHVISKVLRGNNFDKVILGTMHIGIGTNAGTLQGETQSDIHVDGVARNPTITVDGKTIMKDGKLLI